MPIVTPDQIKRKAAGVYTAYLRAWVRGEAEGFFPCNLPANLSVDKQDMAGTIRAFELLNEQSKPSIGWGYLIEKHHIDSPDGRGVRPKRIWIDTEYDLLQLTGKTKEFADTRYVAERLRAELPDLETWIVKQVLLISRYRKVLDELIAVAKYLVEHPMPGCYPQQIPVAVSTKFIAKHESVLRAWLNQLLPASSMLCHESKFERRFGLRERQSFRSAWVQDERLRRELGLPFAEFALPVRSLAELDVQQATIIVVENKTPLMSVPHGPRTLVLTGEGASGPDLASLPWLEQNRVLYWGDMDAAGYAILSNFRVRLPHVESILMDQATFEMHKKYARRGPGIGRQEVPGLHEPELHMYHRCTDGNLMLEQEKLLQSHIHAAFREAYSQSA